MASYTPAPESEDSVLLRWQFCLKWSTHSEWSKSNPSMPFCRIWQLDSKIIWECKGPRAAKTTLKENPVGKLRLPDFMNYYRATVIKTVWYWYENRQIDNAKNSKSTNRPSHVWTMCFQQSAKSFQWEKNHLFNR